MRTEEMHLAAVADPDRQILLMTGAIDTNEFGVLVRLEVPKTGVWTIIKAESNLTTESWTHMVIFLGRGITMPNDASARYLLSQQYSEAAYFPRENAIVFGAGEVRPGEPMLMMFSVELTAGTELYFIYGSRIRLTVAAEGRPTLEELLTYALQLDLPQDDVAVPVRIQTLSNSIVR
jgi:Family of unknown function (DUF6423)